MTDAVASVEEPQAPPTKTNPSKPSFASTPCSTSPPTPRQAAANTTSTWKPSIRATESTQNSSCSTTRLPRCKPPPSTWPSPTTSRPSPPDWHNWQKRNNKPDCSLNWKQLLSLRHQKNPTNEQAKNQNCVNGISKDIFNVPT